MIRASSTPALIKSRHPCGLEIVFDPKIGNFMLHGQSMTPVNRLVDKVFPPFRRGVVAKAVAERESKSVDLVFEDWKKSSLFSKNVAAHFSNSLQKLPSQPLANLHGEEMDFFPAAEQAAASILESSFCVLARDFIVCNPGAKVAGKVDFVLVRDDNDAALEGAEEEEEEEEEEQQQQQRRQASNTREILLLNILVHGPNTLLNNSFRFGRFDSNDVCLPPFSHLPSSKLTRHLLSLALCQRMLQSQGYLHKVLFPPSRETGGFDRQALERHCDNVSASTRVRMAVLQVGRSSEDMLRGTWDVVPVDVSEYLLRPPDCAGDEERDPLEFLMSRLGK